MSLLDRPIVERLPVSGGFTHAERFRAVFDDGTQAFVKRATDDETAAWLRTEHAVYSQLAGAPFLAAMLDFRDGERPILALEDLGGAVWPPPWSPARVAAVGRALDQLADGPAPPVFQPRDVDGLRGWERIADDPTAFLGLGRCTVRWLDAALPTLIAAERRVPDGPDVPCHLDTRSDNLCFVDGRCVLVDWNWAALAPRGIDRAFWSVSLHHEGGPRPEAVVDPDPTWPARVSGFFARMAGLPDLPHAPRVRWIQRVQLDAALPWAVRALGLPPLDGA